MVKRYDGNTGRFIHVEERPERPSQAPERREPPRGEKRREPGRAGPPPAPHRPPPKRGPLPAPLQQLLPGTGELETEDLLLMLILYLLYRESGDQDWLVTLGAMLFL